MCSPDRQPAVPAVAPPVDAQRQRLLHLFRHTLASGEVNPLLLIVPAYRAEPVEDDE